MQKNAPSHFGDELIDRLTLPKEDGGTTTYPVALKPETIVAYANLGVLTFHVPPVQRASGWKPDWLVWDLDPPVDGLDLVRRATSTMKEVLDGFGIETHLLASGSKGYHLRARIEPNLTLDEASGTARGIAALAAASHPDLLTLAFRKSERGDRVFVDWLRNAALSTAVAPWSLRPRPTAPVATPLAWDELDSVAPDGVDMFSAIDRLSKQVWDESPGTDHSSTVAVIEEALSDAGIVLEPFDRFRS